MIVAKISTGTHLAASSQLAQCDTREQADALCDSVEKQNKDSRALPGFSAATISCTRARLLASRATVPSAESVGRTMQMRYGALTRFRGSFSAASAPAAAGAPAP